jgi:uncharacterized protein (TIGR03118 family)
MSVTSLRVAFFGVAALIWTSLLAESRAGYTETFVVSDIQGLAQNFDPNLKNPWGVSFAPNGPFWVSDQANNKTTLYNGAGAPLSLVASIPIATGGANGPTGQVYNNNTSDFLIGGRGAFFLFANLNGQISGFNLGSAAQTVIPGTNAVYTGLAIGQVGVDNVLFAADSKGNKIDVYNSLYHNLNGTTYAGAFVDPSLPTGYKVFNIQNIGGTLYVTYANGTGGTAGTNGGVVATFGLDGHFIKQLISNGRGGPLEDPWGVALAPASFGQFGGDLLVGNKENGQINAFDPKSGRFLGLVATVTNNPASTNNGLWSLAFGTGSATSDPNTLYASAGINNESDGLIVAITPTAVPEPGSAVLVAIGVGFVLVIAHRKRASNRA